MKYSLLSLACCTLLSSLALLPALAQETKTPDPKTPDPKAEKQPAEETAESLIGEATDAIRAGKTDRAAELAGKAIAKDPKNPRTYVLRARIYSSARKAKEAVPDFDQAIALLPKAAPLYDERGSEHFKLGHIRESIADFDKAVAIDPQREPSHWKRGISYYYAGKYAEGRKQFEGYQNFDSNDVENAVWRFLCMSREEGVGFEKARADILKIGEDKRVPMRQVYDLFAGKAQPEDVLAAAKAPTAPGLGHERLFYAHQYLALYYEAKGDAAAAKTHMEKAVEHPIAHYMWDVAKVHVELRKPEAKP